MSPHVQALQSFEAAVYRHARARRELREALASTPKTRAEEEHRERLVAALRKEIARHAGEVTVREVRLAYRVSADRLYPCYTARAWGLEGGSKTYTIVNNKEQPVLYAGSTTGNFDREVANWCRVTDHEVCGERTFSRIK